MGNRDGALVELDGEAWGSGSGTYRSRCLTDGDQPDIASMLESRTGDQYNVDASSRQSETYSIDVGLGWGARAPTSLHGDRMGRLMRSVGSMGQHVTQVDLPVRRQARDASDGGAV